MSIDVTASPSRVKLSGPGGVTWDSDWQNLLITNSIKTSFVVDGVNNSNSVSPHIVTQTNNLGAVHANANICFGIHKHHGRSYSIGGTHVIFSMQEPMSPTGDYWYYTTGDYQVADVIWYYFRITSGQLQVVVNYTFPAGAQWTFPTTTVDVYAFAGTFDY